jgi:hypothetical protein
VSEDRDQLRRCVAFGAAVGWTVLGVSGSLLLSRSLGGALKQPLPEALVLFLVMSVSLASLGLQGAVHWSTGPRRTPDWPEALAIATPILWGIPLLVNGDAFAIGGVFSLWLIHAAGVLCAAWWQTSDPGTGAQVMPARVETRVEAVRPPAGPVVSDSTILDATGLGSAEAGEEETEESESEWPFGEDIDQWQTRSRWENGVVVSGGVLVEFPPGVRETVVHLAFCPPLPKAPELTTEELDGQGWDIRVATALSWGGRLTVRRRESAGEAVAGRIGYSAVCESSAEAA